MPPGRVARARVGPDTIELFVPEGREGMSEINFANRWWQIVAIRQGRGLDHDGHPRIDVDYRDGEHVYTIPGTSWGKTR